MVFVCLFVSFSCKIEKVIRDPFCFYFFFLLKNLLTFAFIMKNKRFFFIFCILSEIYGEKGDSVRVRVFKA